MLSSFILRPAHKAALLGLCLRAVISQRHQELLVPVHLAQQPEHGIKTTRALTLFIKSSHK